jgi:hypothetical protein
MDQQTEKFDCYAIVEVFGHQKMAGRVTEQALGGASFVRIDVPAIDGQPGFTRLYGAATIYSITPCTEELAHKAARYCRAEPVTVYIPPERHLPAAGPTVDPPEQGTHAAHDCACCGSPCDCGNADECDECSACQGIDDD